METKKLAIFQIVKGHDSRTIKVIAQKFLLDLYVVVIIIVYKFYFIWFRQTKVKEWKPTLGRTVHSTYRQTRINLNASSATAGA